MKIAIIEDHALMADLLATLCRRDLKHEVIITEAQGRKGLEAVRKLKPNLVLLDLSLPDIDGLEVASAILKELPKTKVLVLSSLRDPVTLKRVRDLGVHGFVDKRDQNIPLLKEAINLVIKGHEFFSPIINEVVGPLRQDPKAFYRVLSDYEQGVLALIGEAKSDEEIAKELGIKVSTAQSRRRDIMGKLEIHTTPKLIRYAIENGFTRSEHFQRPSEDGA
jgi:DNA-binding NarL/FixJ family response regulator